MTNTLGLEEILQSNHEGIEQNESTIKENQKETLIFYDVALYAKQA